MTAGKRNRRPGNRANRRGWQRRRKLDVWLFTELGRPVVFVSGFRSPVSGFSRVSGLRFPLSGFQRLTVQPGSPQSALRMPSPVIQSLLVLQDRDLKRLGLEGQLKGVPGDVVRVEQKIAAEKAAIETARVEL